MTFIANLDGNRVNSLEYSNTDWGLLKQNERDSRQLTCIECGHTLIPRSGYRIRQHFYHKIENRDCSVSGKQEEHWFLQQLIYRMGIDLGLTPEFEKEISTPYGSHDHRHADVCFEAEKKIVEIQLSQQSFEEYTERTQDYNRQGYDVLWFSWKIFYTELPIAELILLDSDGENITRKDQIKDADDFWVSINTIRDISITNINPLVDVGNVDLSESVKRDNDDWDCFYNSRNQYHRIQGIQAESRETSVQLETLLKSYLIEGNYRTSCDIAFSPHLHNEKCEHVIDLKTDYIRKMDAWRESEFERKLQEEAEKYAYEAEREEWASKYNLTIDDLDKAVAERQKLVASWEYRHDDDDGEWTLGFKNAIKISPDDAFTFICNSIGIEEKFHLRVLKILNKIADERRLPRVMDILKYNPYQIGRTYYNSPRIRRLDKLCESIWQNRDWNHIVYKTSLIDPRNDPDFWMCNCNKGYLEFGYRFFDNGAKAYCIYCSLCHACTSGAAVGKKRIKPRFRRESQNVDVFSKPFQGTYAKIVK